ncbi:unnamed protein product [Didymodactylos carnosus]|uniref:ADP/ATP translocase n=1 Tax=Didymodactylos carnosus TaxID=1234261 RepID=A0A8S2F8V5_9BILA|nr:unnamed protein product [Didymodactylos carnosus]CAF4184945.1 unnamed protein product [Didymodactylos carnosus]
MAVVKEKAPVKLSPIENFALSAVAAVVAKTAAAPIGRVQLLLQCQGEMLKQGTISRPYTGIIDCIRQTFRNEGLIPFWRGYEFCLQDHIKTMFKQNKDDPYMVNFAKNVASGVIAGILSLSFVYSLDYARTRLANDVKSIKNGGDGRKYNGLVDVYRKTFASDGT